MPAIFVSHSSVDRKISDDVKAALARLGFERVFLDFDKETGLGVGDNWEKRLYEELMRCHAVVLVLTPAWLGSKWCFAELTQARALGKVILPVLCEPLGEKFVLPDVQAVDLLGWNPDGLGRLEQRLRAITNELARGFTLDPNRPPYPGIFAFQAEDAAIYFGRDEETRAVIERLDARRIQGGARFLVIIGASGSGKSSLLKASVLPQLARRRAQWIVLPDIRPEKAPLEGLAKAIAQHAGTPEAWRQWYNRLSGPDAVAAIETVIQDARIGEARTATVLLPIDQFEEVFTTTGAADRAAFLGLLASVFARDLPFIVVATGRSDVLEGLIESSELVGHYETYPLPAMPLERVPRLIEGPAAVAGINVEKGLPERIVRDVESAEALPLLAHMLSLLYQRGGSDKKLAIVEYDGLGDAVRGLNPIQNSVRLAADEAIARVKPSEQETASLRDAFVPHLVRVRLDDGKRVRQPARRTELPPNSTRLVNALVEARLLSTRGSDAAGAPIIEVTHESLFKAWPTLDQWLTEEQAFLSDLERIRAAHENWTQAAADQKSGELLYGLLLSRARDWLLKYPQRFVGRDMEPLRAFIAASAEVADAERARARRIRQLVFAVLAAAVLGFAIFGFYSMQLYREAFQAKNDLENAFREVTEANRNAVRERQAADIARQLAEDQTKRAEEQRRIAEAQRNQALITQSRFLTDVARDHFDKADFGSAVALAVEALPDERRGIARPYVASAESTLYQALTMLREQRLPRESGEFWPLSFSPDGQRIVAGGDIWDVTTLAKIAKLEGDRGGDPPIFSPDGQLLVASDDKTVRLWDARDGKARGALEHDDVVWWAMPSPNGRQVLTAYAPGGRTRLWDIVSATWRELQGHEKGFATAAFSSDGKKILTRAHDGTLRLWDAGAESSPVTLGTAGESAVLAFSPDDRMIATSARETKVRLWDVAALKELPSLPHADLIAHVAFSSDSQTIATVTDFSHTPRTWRLADPASPAEFRPHSAYVQSVALPPDRAQMVTAVRDSVRIDDLATALPIATVAIFRGPNDDLVKLSPDGRRLVTPSRIHGAQIWDVTEGGGVQVLRDGADGSTIAAAFSGNGARIFTAGGTIAVVRNASDGAEIARRQHARPILAAAIAPDGRRIVTASHEKNARIWDLAAEAAQIVLPHDDRLVISAAFSADGRRIVTGCQDGLVRLWDAATGGAVMVLGRHPGPVRTVELSPDGSRVVTASEGAVWLSDVTSGAQPTKLGSHGRIETAAFSPDAKHIVTGSNDGTVAIWNSASPGEPITVWHPHERRIRMATFSPDGQRILTASEDGTRIWSAVRGTGTGTGGYQEIAMLPAGAADAAGFSPDGTRVITAREGATRIWPAFPSTQALVEHARAVMPRELTPEQRQQFFLDPAPAPAPAAPQPNQK